MKFKLIFVLIFMMCVVQICADDVKIAYWGDVDGYLREQARQSFILINQILNEFPPNQKEPLVRKSALYLLDSILHDTRVDHNDLIAEFMESRIDTMLKELKQPVKKGVKIFKLYNMGFIVKTSSVTFAMDINRGVTKDQTALFSDELLKKIVENVDILFVSHAHSDHYDLTCIDLFIEAKKPIIATPGFLSNITSEFLQRHRSTSFDEILELNLPISKTPPIVGLTSQPASKNSLNIKILPGTQDNTMNNMYVVTTPEGFSIAHTGDQWKNEDREWIVDIHKKVKTDILLVHCWSMPIEETVKGFSPKLIITGHENELLHTIDHREAYWLNYHRFKDISTSKVFMTWGEVIEIK